MSLDVLCFTTVSQKHYLGLSDNVTYLSESLDPRYVDDKHYKVIFKPSVIVPTVEIR